MWLFINRKFNALKSLENPNSFSLPGYFLGFLIGFILILVIALNFLFKIDFDINVTKRLYPTLSLGLKETILNLYKFEQISNKNIHPPFSLSKIASFQNPIHDPKFESNMPEIPLSSVELDIREKVLSDFDNRINSEFKIPKKLRKRVHFWFDVYTKYDSNVHILHHLRYPWIIYSIIDIRKLIAEGKGPLWLRIKNAEKAVLTEKKAIKSALKNLSKGKSHSKLNARERKIARLLKSLPGSRKSVYNQALENFRSQLGQKNFFLTGLASSQKYLTYMTEIFKDMNLPTELIRLPFVESSFNVNAYSKVGASGIWQIMPRTGRSLLIVNDLIDERNSPIKSTYAAGKILKSYKRALKSWPLAITAYNHGIGGIRKAMKESKSKDLISIINKYHKGSFKFASSNFFSCFLAVLYAESYNKEMFPTVVEQNLVERDILKINKNLKLSYVAKELNISLETIYKYNLDLSKKTSNIFLPKGYELHLPIGTIENEHQKIGNQIKIKKSTNA